MRGEETRESRRRKEAMKGAGAKSGGKVVG